MKKKSYNLECGRIIEVNIVDISSIEFQLTNWGKIELNNKNSLNYTSIVSLSCFEDILVSKDLLKQSVETSVKSSW